MTTYQRETDTLSTLCQSQGNAWQAINPEYATRMRLQNRFRTGIEIALNFQTFTRKRFGHTHTATSLSALQRELVKR